jgi:hypothetical protein
MLMSPERSFLEDARRLPRAPWTLNGVHLGKKWGLREKLMAAKMKRTPQTRREQAEYVVERLTDFGVRINPSSRIGRMLRILRRPGIIEPDDADYPIVLESIRDMYQLRLIVDTMDAHRESRGFRVAADLLRKDLALPQDESKDTPGRNCQFQLYVAALCTNARLPTRHEEPDVTCDVEGAVCGIAAKRLKTIEALEENVKDAAGQIRRAAIPGIIALDLTLAQNPTNRRITSSLESQLHVNLSHAKYHDLFDKKGESIRELVAAKGVLAVWVFESTLRLMNDRTWRHDCCSFWFDTTEDATQDRLLDRFRTRFLSGVPNLIDYAAH